MERKALAPFQVKSGGDRGEVTARVSTFNVVDGDGDVTLPEAFRDGAQVVISAYGHKSWDGALPVGMGWIRNRGTEAVLDGRFFMDTAAGRDTFEVVKELGDLQQWSFGYRVVDSERGTHDGKQVRFLKRLDVHEASPVLIGAGVDTRTLSVKHAGLSSVERAEVERVAARVHAARERERWELLSIKNAVRGRLRVSREYDYFSSATDLVYREAAVPSAGQGRLAKAAVGFFAGVLGVDPTPDVRWFEEPAGQGMDGRLASFDDGWTVWLNVKFSGWELVKLCGHEVSHALDGWREPMCRAFEVAIDEAFGV